MSKWPAYLTVEACSTASPACGVMTAEGRQVWPAVHVKHATGRALSHRMGRVCPGMEQSEQEPPWTSQIPCDLVVRHFKKGLPACH